MIIEYPKYEKIKKVAPLKLNLPLEKDDIFKKKT